MQITDVRIKMLNKKEGNHKAIASFTIDECFVVHDVKIIQSETGLFVGMPRRLTRSGEWKDVAHCLNNETREMLFKAIIDAYELELQQTKETSAVTEE